METRRRNTKISNKENKEQKFIHGKKIKINIILSFVILTIIMIASIYGPRSIELYNRYKKDDAKASEVNKVVYPLEINLSIAQIVEIDSMLENYFQGIKEDVDAADGFSNKEIIEFAINILSEKYSSSGIVPVTALDIVANRYFGVDNIDYKKEGYKSLEVKDIKDDTKINNVYVFTKIKQIEKESSLCELEVNEISEETSKKDSYSEKDVISKKVIIVNKIQGENQDEDKYVFVKNKI